MHSAQFVLTRIVGVLMNSFALFILGNGRKSYLERTIASWEENLIGNPKYKIIFDDSGDSKYREWLQTTYGDKYSVIYFTDNPIGQTKMMQEIFRYLKSLDIDYILELEEDWMLFRKLDVNLIFDVLKNNPQLVQMRIPRTIWYSDYHINDLNAGSLLLDYVNRNNSPYKFNQTWFELQSENYFFSHNPNIFSKDILNEPYLESHDHEYTFGINLMKKYSAFGYWADNPYDGYITHIGIKNKGLETRLESHEQLKY